MRPGGSLTYEFGAFRLDPTERTLVRDARIVPLTPKAFDLLVFLVEHHGRLVDKQALMSAIWPETVVEEANLAYNVSALRKVLDEGAEGPSMIQTVPTKGYRFVAPVTTSPHRPLHDETPGPLVRLGPYHIISTIGAGAMGQVYKARDLRLDRTVAIKVLSPDLTGHASARQRFEREAQAVAALSHPHICPLFDVGYQDGTDFLVMEFVDGETLASRLSRGKLPMDQVLEYGIQIADALSAAHKAGIIHRDLKPGNIMLTRRGAKLLDFGLAKMRAQPGDGALTETATRPPISSIGVIVGTVPYMAPEQLEGKEADARADIFAFGAVLYEMITGKRTFEGSSQATLIANILTAEPAPLPSLEPATPAALVSLVRACLAKDPEKRWGSIYDVLLQLTWIRTQPTLEPAAAGVAIRPFSQMMAAAALLLLGAALVIAFRVSFRNGTPATASTSVLTSTTDTTPAEPMLPSASVVHALPFAESREIQDASNRATYVVDLSACLGTDAVYLRFDDPFQRDGWGPAVHKISVQADGQLIAHFIAGTDDEQRFMYDADGSHLFRAYGEGSSSLDRTHDHRFMDEDHYVVYRFVPPSTRRLIAAIDMWNEFRVTCTARRPRASHARRPQ